MKNIIYSLIILICINFIVFSSSVATARTTPSYDVKIIY